MCNMCIREASTLEPEFPFPEEKVERSHIERMKKKHNIVTDPDDEDKQKDVAYQPDLLAVSTQYTKAVYDLIKEGYLRFQDTKVHTILTRTTQPFHLILGLVTLAAWGASHSGGASLRAWRAVYVATVAVHLGAQVWMTFISGIVLYFSLPRHEFGRVQTILFPVYYAFNAAVSLLALLAYFRTQCLTDFQHTSYIQFALLLSVFSIEAFVRLRLVQPMLRAKHMKTQMEETAGGGQEVGRLILGELAHCPRYMSILKAFRRYHSTIAMGTMITFGCSLYSTMIIVDSICR